MLWAMKLLAKAKAEDKITIDPPSYANLQGSFEKIESVNRKLLRYAWVNFPLAYTQVRQKFKIMIFSVSISNMMINIFVLSFINLFTGCQFSSPELFHSSLVQSAISRPR